MSMDYFFITPESYTFKTFLDRLSASIPWYDLGDNRYNIQSGKRGCWLAMWNYWENGFSSLEETYTEEQMKIVDGIPNCKFFVLTAGNVTILNPVTILIADDPNIYVNDDSDAPLVRGDEFVAKIRSNK